MPTRLPLATLAALAAAAWLLSLGLAGCVGDERPASPPLEVYEGGRAEVLSLADSGRALLIEHEPFDSAMTQPMVMELRLADPGEASGIQPGDKIGFTLVLEQDYRIRNVEKLPAFTRLNLASSADSAGSNAAGADSIRASPSQDVDE